MARYSAGGITGTGSTTLPIISIYSSTTQGCKVREIGLFNTTSTAVQLKVIRLSTLGTAATTLTVTAHEDTIAATWTGTVRNTHTANPTLGGDLGYRLQMGAAVGAAAIFTFGDNGLVVPKSGTAPDIGIGVLVETGSGQVCDAYVVFDV